MNYRIIYTSDIIKLIDEGLINRRDDIKVCNEDGVFDINVVELDNDLFTIGTDEQYLSGVDIKTWGDLYDYIKNNVTLDMLINTQSEEEYEKENDDGDIWYEKNDIYRDALNKTLFTFSK